MASFSTRNSFATCAADARFRRHTPRHVIEYQLTFSFSSDVFAMVAIWPPASTRKNGCNTKLTHPIDCTAKHPSHGAALCVVGTTAAAASRLRVFFASFPSSRSHVHQTPGRRATSGALASRRCCGASHGYVGRYAPCCWPPDACPPPGCVWPPDCCCSSSLVLAASPPEQRPSP